MSESKARSKHRLEIFARANGKCIYCGGGVDATTVDHMPPRSMFASRFRPAGLEFAACGPCNNGAARADLVAALLGRVYPDAKTDAERDEVRRLLVAVGRDIPGLLEEMFVGEIGQRMARRDHGLTSGGVLNWGGPLVKRHMQAFGLRLGLALHFHETNLIVPPAGGVAVRFYSNLDLFKGDVPEELFEVLPAPRTLRQGSFNVDEQFRYGTVPTSSDISTMSFASFRLSFAVLAFTTADRSTLEDISSREHFVSPGSW